MLLLLILAFTLVPVFELSLLFYAGRTLGWWETVGIVLFTGVLGAHLAKAQGYRAWRRIRDAMAEGRAPGKELMEGVLILAAGLVLLTPGFATDLCGFALLIPQLRQRLAAGLIQRMVHKPGGGMQWRVYHSGSAAPPSRQGASDIIDVEGKSVGDDDVMLGQ